MPTIQNTHRISLMDPRQLQQHVAVRLMSPSQLQARAREHSRPTLSPLPTPQLTLVSDLLELQSRKLGSAPVEIPVLRPLFSSEPRVADSAVVSPHADLSQRLQQAVEAGLNEWRRGVRETSQNSSPRIDIYARNAKFGRGYEWCGFFAAFAHSQARFKYPEHYASYQKARDFFMYRNYTDRSQKTNQELDRLRQLHQQQSSTRQYFMLQESPNRNYVRQQGAVFKHYNVDAHTFTWQNLPVQPGDIALFHHGHVALVVSYDRNTGKLVTVEGNTSGRGPDGKQWNQAVVMKEYDLSKASDRWRFDGFGRPALGDFN